MNGLKLIEKIYQINNQCPVVLMTGYGHKITREVQDRLKILKLLAKPVMVSDLANSLKVVF